MTPAALCVTAVRLHPSPGLTSSGPQSRSARDPPKASLQGPTESQRGLPRPPRLLAGPILEPENWPYPPSGCSSSSLGALPPSKPFPGPPAWRMIRTTSPVTPPCLGSPTQAPGPPTLYLGGSVPDTKVCLSRSPPLCRMHRPGPWCQACLRTGVSKPVSHGPQNQALQQLHFHGSPGLGQPPGPPALHAHSVAPATPVRTAAWKHVVPSSLTDQPDQPLSCLHPDSGPLPGKAGDGGGEAGDGAPCRSQPAAADTGHQVSSTRRLCGRGRAQPRLESEEQSQGKVLAWARHLRDMVGVRLGDRCPPSYSPGA